MNRCPSCCVPNRVEARFCVACQQPLNSCPKCGERNRSLAKHCCRCGTQLKATCPHCGTVHRLQARYCGGCGGALASWPISSVVRCSNCNHPNRLGARFCPKCGRPIGQRPRYGTGLLPASTVLRQRYVILGQIARGGQGAIYRVGDMRLTGKVWALKEMSESAAAPQVGRQEAIDSFRREAEMLAQLEHLNLPKVVDIFEEQDKQYMVMEFIDGKTLLKLMEEACGPLPVDLVLEWAEQLCDVLGYLHGQKPPIVYRDMKPQNVMEVSGTHAVKVIDFGIARFYAAGKKKDTVKMGTPGYAPPEQYGKGQTDGRADVYALGAMLHYLLTRRDPATELFKFPPVRSLNSTVPREVDDAIMKAVSIRVESRHASMQEMSRALLGKRKRVVFSPIYSAPPSRVARSYTKNGAPGVSTPGPGLWSSTSARLNLSASLLDFGQLDKGCRGQHSFQVSDGSGLTGRVFAREPWIQVSPAKVSGSSQVVEVTVNTAILELAPGKTSQADPNWRGAVWRSVQRLAAEGSAAVAGLVLCFPLVLGALVAGGLADLAAWLALLHARHLVPGDRDHQGRVQVETDSGDSNVEVKVTVRPSKQDLAVGWLKVAGAMLIELAAAGGLLILVISRF